MSSLLETLTTRPPARFVYAFQLALALVIAYWLALSFDWGRPKWAAIAIISIAVPHVGMSLGRAAQRIAGTLFGASVAILIIALFPQDRWLFILSLSLWLAVCTYMMGFSKRSYFWHCAGFICGIIAANAANVAGNSFMIAIDRTLETSLGIVIYTLVALLVWRVRPEGDPPASTVPELFFPDLDQLAAAARVFVIFWLGFLAIVYIPDFPAGMAFLAPLAPLVMAIAATPQLPVKALHNPVLLGLMVASALYIFVMPKLSGFAELALLLFPFGLIVAYQFYAPKDTLARMLVLYIFLALAGISNDQSYTFAAVSSNILTFLFVLVLLHIAATVPARTLPETQFLKLLERFRTSARQIAEGRTPANFIEAWQFAYHRHELATIPGKLKAWLPRLTPMLTEPIKNDIDKVLQAVSECQKQLLEEGNESAEAGSSALEPLSTVYGRIDWPGLQQPRF